MSKTCVRKHVVIHVNIVRMYVFQCVRTNFNLHDKTYSKHICKDKWAGYNMSESNVPQDENNKHQPRTSHEAGKMPPVSLPKPVYPFDYMGRNDVKYGLKPFIKWDAHSGKQSSSKINVGRVCCCNPVGLSFGVKQQWAEVKQESLCHSLKMLCVEGCKVPAINSCRKLRLEAFEGHVDRSEICFLFVLKKRWTSRWVKFQPMGMPCNQTRLESCPM